ncbi:T9SS type A sorting domain-containing protein [Patescibacteria group bacterium]|nr:MAG: T9SS type A sorting domain-containing protein [Patescibacteria group bacterium]
MAQPSLQPTGYQLSANYPNPFNSSTWIEYSVPYQSSVTLKVMDVLGRELATLVSGERGAGRHRVEWNAGRSPSGVYFYRLVARPLSGVQLKEYSETQKLILLK